MPADASAGAGANAGEDTGGANTEAGTPQPNQPNASEVRLRKAKCERILACEPELAKAYPDVDTCMRALEPAWPPQPFDPAQKAVDTCVRAWSKHSCLSLDLQPDACLALARELWMNTPYGIADGYPGLAEGETCGLGNFDCRPGLVCQGDSGDCGVCVKAPLPGEPCNSQRTPDPWADRFACLESACADDGKCKRDTAQLPRLGEPCDYHGCASPLRCKDRVCVAQSNQGGKCADHADCQGWLACVQGTCLPRSAHHQGDLDDVCSQDHDCTEGLGCATFYGRCARPSRLGELSMVPGPGCSTGLVTLWESVTCAAGKKVGEPCETPDECESWNCAEGTCAAPHCGVMPVTLPDYQAKDSSMLGSFRDPKAVCSDQRSSPWETDVDCGGVCDQTCKLGQQCEEHEDCPERDSLCDGVEFKLGVHRGICTELL